MMTEDDDLPPTENTPKGDEKILDRMHKQFELSVEESTDNRKNGLSALKFRAGGENQWDGDVLKQWQDGGRPTESYNQVPLFVNQVINDMRMNMPEVKFIPGNDGEKDTADVLEDLVRAIQSTSEAEVAYDTAADNQVTIGWGYWRILKEYENNETLDQILKVKWIQNAFTIYDDPHATEQDKSDRSFLIQVSDMDYDEFNEEYDREYGESDLVSIGDKFPDWAGKETVRVAEYWTVKKTTTKKTIDGKQRDVTTQKVMWYKCTATEILDRQEWDGIYIPYVFVPGNRLNIDGKIKLFGLVENMMSVQRQYNYWLNTATKAVASIPNAPYLLDPLQLDNETMLDTWDKSNVQDFPYLPYKRIVNGQDYGRPERAQAGADISSMMQLVQMAQQNFYNTTGIFPPSLGKQGNETSGVAINARQKEGDESTYHYRDNMARGIRFEGRIFADLIPKTYDTERMITVMGKDKKPRTVQINKEFKQNGKIKKYDFTIGTYDIGITTGQNYTTRRQETAEQLTQLAQSYPPLMQVAGGDIIRSMDIEGGDLIADKLDALAPPQIQAINNQNTDIPPAIQGMIGQLHDQLQQAQQVIQQGHQQMQQLEQQLQSKQADTQVKMADAQTKQTQAQVDQQNAQLKAAYDKESLALDRERVELDRQKLQLEHAKVDQDTMKMHLDAKTSMDPMVSMSDPTLHAGEPPMITMVNTLAQSLQAGLQEIAQLSAAGTKEVVESNKIVAATNQQVAAAIMAPKVIHRRADGLIDGITVQ